MPRLIIIGLDFGTAFTKCVFRDVTKDIARPVAFFVNGRRTYFVDSFINLSRNKSGDETLSSPFESSLQKDFTDGCGTRRYLKVRLLKAALERDTSPDLLDDARLSAAYYLSHVLFCALDQIHSWVSGFNLRITDLKILVQMCMPDRHSDQSKSESLPRDIFRKVLSAAYDSALSSYANCLKQGHTPGDAFPYGVLPTLLEVRNALVSEGTDNPQIYSCISETYAISKTVVRNSSVPSGFFFLVDVGGGTLDVSLVYIDRKNNPAMNIYENEVIFRGSTVFDLELKRRFPQLSTRQVINLKEGRRVGIPSGFDFKLFEAAKSEIAQAVYLDCARALGSVVWRSLAFFGPLKVKENNREIDNPALWPTVKRSEFQNFQYIFLGNGFTPEPYEIACRYFYRAQHWDINPGVIQLMPPNDFQGLDPEVLALESYGHVASSPIVMRRFAVAYGLTFEPDPPEADDGQDGLRPSPVTSVPPEVVEIFNPRADYIDT